jgi:lipopolysaccharide transport system permease protein
VSTTVEPDYEIRIKPNQGWFIVDWKGIRDYRDLLFLLVRRDFVSRYQQTILGPIWFIINPLVAALMNVLVLTGILNVKTDGVPAVLFFFCGQITWSYFSGILDSTSNTFLANAHLFGKVYFPRLVVPIAQALSNLINFGVQLLAFGVIFAAVKLKDPGSFGINPGMLALFPLFVIHMAMLGLGAGMIISAFTAKYRDFRYLTGFLQNIWMMASAVMFPTSQLLAKVPHQWEWVVALNPMISIIEGSRLAFLGAGTFNPIHYFISLGVSIVIFLVGLMLFQRSARTFVDTI